MSAAGTGFVYHHAYTLHDPGPYDVFYPTPDGRPIYEDPIPHFDGPLKVKRVKELVERTGLSERLTHVSARAADFEELYLFHTRDYVRRVVEALCAHLRYPARLRKRLRSSNSWSARWRRCAGGQR